MPKGFQRAKALSDRLDFGATNMDDSGNDKGWVHKLFANVQSYFSIPFLFFFYWFKQVEVGGDVTRDPLIISINYSLIDSKTTMFKDKTNISFGVSFIHRMFSLCVA